MKSNLTFKNVAFFCLVTFFSINIFSQEIMLTPSIPFKKPSSISTKSASTKSEDNNSDLFSSQTNRLKSLTTNQLSYEWGKYMATSYNDRFYANSIDLNGNVVVVGSKGYNSSDADAVIFMFDSYGNLLWDDKPCSSSDYDGIYEVVNDNNGFIYVTGQFSSTAFNGKIQSNGSSDIFIAKYNTYGDLVWANNAGGYYEDYGCGIDVDAFGNVYVVGFFNGTAYWNNIVKTSSEEGDMFIAKFDSNGKPIWVRTGDIGENNYLYGISVDNSGNCYTSTKFENGNQIEGSPVLNSNGESDMVLIKYDTNGQFKWTKTAGGPGSDGGNDVSVDYEGNVHVTGYFRETAIFGNKTLTSHGVVDIFDAKYSSNGNLLWVKQFGGNGSQTGWDVETDKIGNSYITGWFSGTGAFDNTTIVSEGGTDAYLLKYDKNGNLLWIEQTAAGINDEVCNDISVKDNKIIISGRFEGEMDILGSGFPHTGEEDAYVAKLFETDVLQPYVLVNPGLNISSSQIKQGQSIEFSGQQFSPIGKVDLSFTGAGTLSTVNDIPIEVNGSFQYTLAINSNQTTGNYVVTATDRITGKSVIRNFQIISNQEIVEDFLQITSPGEPETKNTYENIIITWSDKANFEYKLKHSYLVQYQIDNGIWQTIETVDGENKGYELITGNTQFTPSKPGIYKFKVTDNNDFSRYRISPLITVISSVISDINIEYLWDKSYEEPLNISNPVGVAADGVGRFYMVVSNANSLSSGIQKVKVTLSDPDGYMATQFLGKVKFCSSQNGNDFYTDGNYANSIEAENLSSNVDGKYWFWYVAPEDFSRNQGDWGEGERTISITFQITLINGNQLSPIKKKIKIVRPPLMLVHGLTGDHKTWDYFTNAIGEPFINDRRFINLNRAVDMLPTSAFNENSALLLEDESQNVKNSFISLIREVREQGFACNQVDYVCHSMGGSIFRNAVTNFIDSYKGKYNYNKGYAHKFISLHTPHQGSSFANFLYSVDNEGNWLIQGVFDKKADLFECSKLSCSLVDAVKDLRFKDGIKFTEMAIPSHLIGSGISCPEYPKETKKTLLEVALLLNNPFIINPIDLCNSLDYYFTRNDLEAGFIENNDGIVSVQSQFSGYNINSLPKNCSYIPGLMHNSDFGESPTSSYEVGKKVDELLNANVKSELFDYLPSTFPIKSKSEEKQNQQLISIITNKIQILYPENNSEYYAGDTITIKANIDTVGLQNFGLIFQKQVLFENPANPDIEFKLVVSQDDIENQEILIIGNYIESDSLKQSYTKINVKVNPVGSIVDFSVDPEVILIEKWKSRRLKYEAIFPNAISSIGITNLITVSIANPLIVGYDTETNEFIGLEAGSTNAVITYRGISKRVFFEIVEYETPPVNPVTNIDAIELFTSNSQINIKTYPNPFTQEITFEFAATAEGDLRMEITNMNGQIVKSYIFNNQPVGLNCKTIDLSELSDGIYLYKLLSKNNYQVGKIVKKKNN